MGDWRSGARDRVKQKSEGTSIKIAEGSNCLRVLPDKKDLTPEGKVNPKGIVNPPYREFRVHRNVGPDKAMCGCGKDIEGKGKCWLCDVKIPELEGSGNSAKRAQANEIRAAEQFVVHASKFDSDTQKFGGPKPWWVSTGSGIPGKQGQSLAVRVYSKIASSKKDYVDPVKGYNINIERTGQMLQTRYTEVEGDETPSKVPASVLAAVKDLDSVVPAYDAEDQKSAYYGRPKKENAERDEAPRRRVAKPAPAEDESEPEETEEEESEAAEDEPEEETPADEEEPEEAEEEPADEPEDEPEEEEEEPAEEEPEEEPEPVRPARKAAPAPAKKVAPPAKKTAPTKRK
jgi:hypothetical protein